MGSANSDGHALKCEHTSQLGCPDFLQYVMRRLPSSPRKVWRFYKHIPTQFWCEGPASRGVRVDYLRGGKLLHRRLPNRAALSRVLGSLWTKRRFVLLGRFPSTSRQPLSWSRLKGVRLAFICCEKIKPWKRKTFGVRRNYYNSRSKYPFPHQLSTTCSSGTSLPSPKEVPCAIPPLASDRGLVRIGLPRGR